jgi:hypothetical protein
LCRVQKKLAGALGTDGLTDGRTNRSRRRGLRREGGKTALVVSFWWAGIGC